MHASSLDTADVERSTFLAGSGLLRGFNQTHIIESSISAGRLPPSILYISALAEESLTDTASRK